jgi:catechol 2,3-dioxygenase-like lactoylglutathione lyase family enzyme
MKLNHINLSVTDVPAAESFLKTYFGLRSSADNNEKFAVVFDDDGLVLSLMKAGQGIQYPATFHIGFIQSTEAQVNEMNQRLKNDGFDVQPPQHRHAWTFYVQAPGGFTVEVLA